MLRRAADLIRARNRELAELETLDTGKPLSETLVADWASGADALEWFAALAAALAGEAIDLGGDLVYTRREPLGVCARHRRLELPSPDRLLEGRAGARLRQRA